MRIKLYVNPFLALWTYNFQIETQLSSSWSLFCSELVSQVCHSIPETKVKEVLMFNSTLQLFIRQRETVDFNKLRKN